jgi:hypothetical protein
MDPNVSRSIIEALFFNEILKDKTKLAEISALWNEKDKK